MKKGGHSDGIKACFFEKKKGRLGAKQKPSASPARLIPDSQKFFGSFFQKRTAFLLPSANGALKPR
jgi:hypothetical protein